MGIITGSMQVKLHRLAFKRVTNWYSIGALDASAMLTELEELERVVLLQMNDKHEEELTRRHCVLIHHDIIRCMDAARAYKDQSKAIMNVVGALTCVVAIMYVMFKSQVV
jgi:hypothetical protein